MNIYVVAFVYDTLPNGVGIKRILEVLPSTVDENVWDWRQGDIPRGWNNPASLLGARWRETVPQSQIEYVHRTPDLGYMAYEAKAGQFVRQTKLIKMADPADLTDTPTREVPAIQKDVQ